MLHRTPDFNRLYAFQIYICTSKAWEERAGTRFPGMSASPSIPHSMDPRGQTYLLNGGTELLDGSLEQRLLLLINLADRQDLFNTVFLPVSFFSLVQDRA